MAVSQLIYKDKQWVGFDLQATARQVLTAEPHRLISTHHKTELNHPTEP